MNTTKCVLHLLDNLPDVGTTADFVAILDQYVAQNPDEFATPWTAIDVEMLLECNFLSRAITPDEMAQIVKYANEQCNWHTGVSWDSLQCAVNIKLAELDIHIEGPDLNACYENLPGRKPHPQLLPWQP